MTPISPPIKTNYWAVFALWLAGLTSAAQFAKITVTFAQFDQIYPHAGDHLGWLLSLISFIGIVLGLFAGLVVAKLGFKRLLVMALLLGAMISLFQITTPSFSVMLLSRVIEGLSHLVIVVAAPTLIAKLSAPAHVNFSMTLWSTFFGVAYAITTWLGIPLIDQYGFGALFIAHAAIMTGVALSLLWLLPQDDVSTQAQAQALTLRTIIKAHIEIYRSPFLSAPALGWLCYTLTYVSLLTVLPQSVPDDQRSFLIGFLPLTGIVTSLMCGVLLLRVFRAVNVVIGSFLIACLALFMFWLGAPITLVAILAFGTLGLVQSSTFAAIPQIVHKADEQAKANGAVAQLGNLGNTFGTPILLFLLSNYNIDGMIAGVILFYIIGALTHFYLDQKRRKPLS